MSKKPKPEQKYVPIEDAQATNKPGEPKPEPKPEPQAPEPAEPRLVEAVVPKPKADLTPRMIDAGVEDWYDGLSRGQVFTVDEAAKELQLSTVDLTESLKRLKQKRVGGFGHIVGFE